MSRLSRCQGDLTPRDHELRGAPFVGTVAYRPFGQCAYGCGSEPAYGYTGEYREAPPNLVYLHSRWYDPTIGRFLSADDRLGRLSMPQDQNRYAYVVNNPLAYTDPTGHFLNIIIGAIAGAIIGGVGCWLAGGEDCWKAALVGMVAGAVAGATFNLAAGSATFIALTGGGAATTIAAGALAGAAAGAASYLFRGSMATLTGERFDWSAQDFFLEVGLGAVLGAAFAAGGVLVGKGISALRIRTSGWRGWSAIDSFRRAVNIWDAKLTGRLVNPRIPQVLESIEATGGPPQGYVGGRVYRNVGPAKLPNRSLGYYSEYDITRSVPGVGRDNLRIVLGQHGDVWFTDTHYGSFNRLW